MLIPLEQIVEKPKSQIVAETLIEGVNSGFDDRILRFKNLWETLWENGRATPEEILEKLGTKAILIFQTANLALQDLTAMCQISGSDLSEVLGNSKYLTVAKPITVNQDGSVIITPVEE
jgi:hypothetical protein